MDLVHPDFFALLSVIDRGWERVLTLPNSRIRVVDRLSKRGLLGFEPANFLDVGGTADAARVEQAFRIILKDPNVKAILVNIFGGIVRCDRVAQGVVDAYKNMGEINVPIIVRLQGTNAVEAKEIIDNSGLKVMSAIALKEAAEKVQEALS